MVSVDLRDKNLRKKYAAKYFDTLKRFFSYSSYRTFVELEKKRNLIHTYEYWWIKYKMLKRYAKLNCLSEIEENDFERQKREYKSIEKFTESLFDDFLSANSNIDSKYYDSIKSFLFEKLYWNWIFSGSALINADGDCFNRKDFLAACLPQITDMVKKKKEYDLFEWHISNKLVLQVANYFSSYKTDSNWEFCEQKELLDYIETKFHLYSVAKDWFNRYYKSKKIIFDFDDVFNKYGVALFDFTGKYGLVKIDGEPICPYDSKEINNAANLIISFYINKLFSTIREYERIFKCKIILDAGYYWSFVRQRVISYLFDDDAHAFEDNWWLEFEGTAISSKISLVPIIVFDNFSNKMESIK